MTPSSASAARSASRSGAVHLIYPHGPSVSTPDAIGRELGARLERSFEVSYHDWTDRGIIRPSPGDVLLGHPHPSPHTIFRRSAKQPGWARVLLLSPFNHADLSQVAFVDECIRDCDRYLAITGNYWFSTIAKSPCAHWAPKMIHLDLAVDERDFPPVKQSFAPARQRSFVYIGHTGRLKNTSYLTAIAQRLPGVRFGWIGKGPRPIRGLEQLGPVDFSTDGGRRLVSEFDFMVTVGHSDANPTTILESMGWGLIPVCTPQSGYTGIESVPNVPLRDANAAAEILAALNSAPTERLHEFREANRGLLRTHFNWDRFAAQVIDAIVSDESPAVGPEPWARRVRFALATVASPLGPVANCAVGRLARRARRALNSFRAAR